jgi:hypothetical protein
MFISFADIWPPGDTAIELIRFYWQYPAARAELGAQAALDRLALMTPPQFDGS